MRKVTERLTAFVLSLLLLFLTGCGAVTPPEAVEKPSAEAASQNIEPLGKVYFSYFDTASYIYSYAGDSEELFNERCEAVAGILNEYHSLFDIYHEYTGVNNLCTLNRMAGKEAMEADDRLIDFLLYAKELYETTDGEMNVMLGSVLGIWHEARTLALDDPSAAEVPDAEELAAANSHTDISLLEIDTEKKTVRISDPSASIDVGALGKGYATERAAEWLEEHGAESYVLNIGGNIRIIGTRPDGTGWNTGIKDPSNPQSDFARKLKLSDTSCVTSGVYERFFTVNGVRYHHIIDKDTLFPSEYFSSVTVITPDSALADALSTALFCMSAEQGKALVEGLGNVEVLWITPDGKQLATPGIEALTLKE